MGNEEFDDLDSATEHAKAKLADMAERFGATAVKIIDETGTPHFLKAISRT